MATTTYEIVGWLGVEGTVDAGSPEEAVQLHRKAVHDYLCTRHESFLDVARIMKDTKYTARPVGGAS